MMNDTEHRAWARAVLRERTYAISRNEVRDILPPGTDEQDIGVVLNLVVHVRFTFGHGETADDVH